MESSSQDDDKPTEATDAPPKGEPMITEATLIASSDPSLSSTLGHEWLARLEAAMATILEN